MMPIILQGGGAKTHLCPIFESGGWLSSTPLSD